MYDYITIKGARENNLKNISLEIPKNKLVVLTGLSGSGKSTIAFDTLQKECQRQYMESLGLGTDFISKPKVDTITGLSPSISIDQHLTNRNPRSTVGTVTEIYTYLRVLFSKLGKRDCPKCGKIIELEFENDSVEIWDRDTEDIDEGDTKNNKSSDDNMDFVNTVSCPNCANQVPELTMSSFSFNKPQGACPTCTGLGIINDADISMLIDSEKSIEEYAITGWDVHYVKRNKQVFDNASKHYGFTLDVTVPVKELGQVEMDFLLYGAHSPRFMKHFPNVKPPSTVTKGAFEGVVTNILRRYSEGANDPKYREKIEKYLIQQVCPDCEGNKLRKEIQKVIVDDTTIIEASKMSLDRLREWIIGLKDSVTDEGMKIVKPIVEDVSERLKRLIDVGVGYLTLDRSAPTLSAGEAQRLRLALLLGSGLTGVLYVLDEPTTGLHARDTERLIKVLKQLRDSGNTILVIEHDMELVKACDHVIDIGPGAGENGGEVVAFGTPSEVAKCEKSITGKYLSETKITIEESKRKGNGRLISIKGARENNLKNIDVDIPLGMFVALTGVSGSGKSTLLLSTLGPVARNYFNQKNEVVGKHDRVEGLEHVDKIITIDQIPIGRTARSNSATYTDVFTPIREIYAKSAEAKKRKLKAKHFSFNVKGGRCEKCQGAGVLTINMNFLPEVQVRCPVCHGKRFRREVLAVKYKDKSIADVLNMTIDEAIDLFKDEKIIYDRLLLLEEVGLGYLKLGQPANTLSGGEAQRLKLAKELGKRGKGHTLYLLDEPTTGLHPQDVLKLTSLLERLVDAGNTVVVIEHNLDVIGRVDWIIDFGPEGGNGGGKIVAKGNIKQVLDNKQSMTVKQLIKTVNIV